VVSQAKKIDHGRARREHGSDKETSHGNYYKLETGASV
jgi:hypothetical protein